jgi:hypothetical protein
MDPVDAVMPWLLLSAKEKLGAIAAVRQHNLAHHSRGILPGHHCPT